MKTETVIKVVFVVGLMLMAWVLVQLVGMTADDAMKLPANLK